MDSYYEWLKYINKYFGYTDNMCKITLADSVRLATYIKDRIFLVYAIDYRNVGLAKTAYKTLVCLTKEDSNISIMEHQSGVYVVLTQGYSLDLDCPELLVNLLLSVSMLEMSVNTKGYLDSSDLLLNTINLVVNSLHRLFSCDKGITGVELHCQDCGISCKIDFFEAHPDRVENIRSIINQFFISTCFEFKWFSFFEGNSSVEIKNLPVSADVLLDLSEM